VPHPSDSPDTRETSVPHVPHILHIPHEDRATGTPRPASGSVTPSVPDLIARLSVAPRRLAAL
jgi:hypothetical protein